MADLAILPAGTFQLLFQSWMVQPAFSSPISISIGLPIQLSVLLQPGNATGGIPSSRQPQVSVQDSGSNLVPISFSTISATLICAGFVPCVLKGTTRVSTMAGIAIFSDLTIDHIGSGYRISFSAYFSQQNISANIGSEEFEVLLGPPNKIVVSQHPQNSLGGEKLQPAPVVCLADQGGNLIRADTGGAVEANRIQITLAGGLSGAQLSGNAGMVQNTTCIAFRHLAIIKGVGTGYLLFTDSRGSLKAANSSEFTVQVGPPAQIQLRVQPASSIAGLLLTPQPVVEVSDLGLNQVNSYAGSMNVTLVYQYAHDDTILPVSYPEILRYWFPPTNRVFGSTSFLVTNGTAYFTDLQVNKMGRNYTLSFSTLFASAISEPFDVAIGKMAKLIILSNFSSIVGGMPFPFQPTISITDAMGNFISLSTSIIKAGFKEKSKANANLLGEKTAAVNLTAAYFSDLGIDLVGVYSLNFSLQKPTGSFLEVISAPFNVTYGTPYQLDLRAENQKGGFFIAGAGEPTLGFEMRILDEGSNSLSGFGISAEAGLWEQRNETRIFLCSGPLSCLIDVNASIRQDAQLLSAVVSIDLICTDFDYTTEQISRLDIAGKNLLKNNNANVFTGPWPHCFGSCLQSVLLLKNFDVLNESLIGAFTVALSATPQVNVYPCDGNFLNAIITLNLSYIVPLDSSKFLIGNTTILNYGMTVTPFLLAVTRPGGPYELKIDSQGLVGASLQWIDVIVGHPAQLNISKHPGSGFGGEQLLIQPQVQCLDMGNNLVTADNSSIINVSLVSPSLNSSLPRLLGLVSVQTVMGIADFRDLAVDLSGSGYRLRFSAAFRGKLATAASAQFSIEIGPPTQLVLTRQPVMGYGGEYLPVWVVCSADAGGNHDDFIWSSANMSLLRTDPTLNTDFVDVLIGKNGAVRGRLFGTTQITMNSSGCTEFTDLRIDLAGSAYTLIFHTNLALRSVESLPFKIAVGAASTLNLESTLGPSIKILQLLPVQPVVSIRDLGGNLVFESSRNVTVLLESLAMFGDSLTDPRLFGNHTVSTVHGFAYFYDLGFASPGKFKLQFSSLGLQNISSDFIQALLDSPNATILIGTASIRGASIASFEIQTQRGFASALAEVVGVNMGAITILSIESNIMSNSNIQLQVTFQVVLASQTAAKAVMSRVSYSVLRNALFGHGLFLNLDGLVWNPKKEFSDPWSGWWTLQAESDRFDTSIIHNSNDAWLNLWGQWNNRSLSCAGPTMNDRMRMTCYDRSETSFAVELVKFSDDEANGFLTRSSILEAQGPFYIRDMVITQMQTATGTKDFLIAANSFNGTTAMTQSIVYTISTAPNNTVSLEVRKVISW